MVTLRLHKMVRGRRYQRIVKTEWVQVTYGAIMDGETKSTIAYLQLGRWYYRGSDSWYTDIEISAEG